MHTLRCETCHAMFEAAQVTARWCSGRCRAKAHRDHRAARHGRMTELLRELASAANAADPEAHRVLVAEARRLAREPF